MIRKLTFLMLILNAVQALAQQNGEHIEMADALYESGKIYVVVSVLSIIFIGIIIYLIVLDRKISKLEKNQQQ